MEQKQTPSITSRQCIYAFILTYQEKEHHAPTIRDICRATGLKSTSTVQGHVDRMIRDGLLTKINGRCRTLWAKPGAMETERG